MNIPLVNLLKLQKSPFPEVQARLIANHFHPLWNTLSVFIIYNPILGKVEDFTLDDFFSALFPFFALVLWNILNLDHMKLSPSNGDASVAWKFLSDRISYSNLRRLPLLLLLRQTGSLQTDDLFPAEFFTFSGRTSARSRQFVSTVYGSALIRTPLFFFCL